MIIKNVISKIRNEIVTGETVSRQSKQFHEIRKAFAPKEDGLTKIKNSDVHFTPTVTSTIDFMSSNCAYPSKKRTNPVLSDLNLNFYDLHERSNASSQLNLDITKDENSSLLDLSLTVVPSTDISCFNSNTSFDNSSSDDTTLVYPEELRHINMTQLISYAILFPLAAIGNLLVFVALFRNRHRKSRVNLMLLHLSLADMIVTFIFLPTEIIWHINIEWVFGNIGCKVYKYLSAFGFYISSMVLVCISLDRYFAVLHPLKVNDAQRRGKIMLFFAWLISAVLSIPQEDSVTSFLPQSYSDCQYGFRNGHSTGDLLSFLSNSWSSSFRNFGETFPVALDISKRFHRVWFIQLSVIFKVQSHPTFPTFQQCVTFGFFDAHEEMIYTAFVISFLYFIPLAIIIVAYSRIIVEITKKSKETKGDPTCDSSSSTSGGERHLRLRRSNMSTIARARSRTLSMTFIIVMAFVWCWTPYSICTLWNFIDQDTFRRMNLHLQDILFILAVSNSVVNPIIYGRYSLSCFRKNKEVRKPTSCISSCYFCYWFCCCCLSPVVMETEFRENKLFNASGMTRSTATLNNRSIRFSQCKYFVNGLYRTVNRQSKPEVTPPIGRRQRESIPEPELISMVHLGLRSTCEIDGSELHLKVLGSIPEEDLNNTASSIRPILRNELSSAAAVDNDPSYSYSPTEGHCHSFQEVEDRKRLFAAWKSPNSC